MNAEDIKRLDKLRMASEEKYLLYYLSYNKHNLTKSLKKLMAKGLITRDLVKSYRLTTKGETVIAPYLDKEAFEAEEQDESLAGTRLERLAKEMQKHYPSGLKPGTSSQWRGSANVIIVCLQSVIDFIGFEFSDEEAIKAVDDYVNSFGDDTRYMCLLKYFIYKVDYDENRNPVRRSIMQEYIENARTGNENNGTNNWTTVIR